MCYRESGERSNFGAGRTSNGGRHLHSRSDGSNTQAEFRARGRCCPCGLFAVLLSRVTWLRTGTLYAFFIAVLNHRSKQKVDNQSKASFREDQVAQLSMHSKVLRPGAARAKPGSGSGAARHSCFIKSVPGSSNEQTTRRVIHLADIQRKGSVAIEGDRSKTSFSAQSAPSPEGRTALHLNDRR